jgi:DNA-binding transcriptional ArsR family regulator
VELQTLFNRSLDRVIDRMYCPDMPVVPRELLEEVARLFGLLSDPTRLRLLSRLHDDGELSVGELAERTGVAVANVSQHLNRLAVAGVVARRREGKQVRYRIADPRLEELCDLVCSGVRERAELLAG